MNTTYHRTAYSNRVEDINLPSWIKAFNAAEAIAMEAVHEIEFRSKARELASTLPCLMDTANGLIALQEKNKLENAFKHLSKAIEETLQNHAYPCNGLPPAQMKPPESLIDGTMLAALFGLYSTCLRLTNPDDLGYQLQPEARQLINNAINKVRYTCEQPTIESK